MTRKNRIIQQLEQQLTPHFLEVHDESQYHHVPKGAETHFKVIMVANEFNGLTRIARHRLINQLLKDEFESGLHALSLHLYTPSEWEKNHQSVLQSPSCKDGYKNK